MAPIQALPRPPPAPRNAISWRAKGAILSGLGLVSAAVGTWAGLEALANSRAAEPYCATGMYSNVCDPQGIALRDEGRKYTHTATIGLSFAFPLLVFGTWMLVTSPASWEQRTQVVSSLSSAQPTLSLTPGGVVVGQRF